MALVVGIFVVLAVNAVFRVRRDLGIFENDMRRDHHMITRALTSAVSEIWRSEGEARAMRLVEEVNERDSQLTIRWVWLGTDEAPVEGLDEARYRRVLDGKEVDWRTVAEGKEQLVTLSPVPTPSGRLGAIEVAESLDGERDYISTTILSTAIQTGLLAAVCAGLTLGLGIWFVGKPMKQLIAHARRIGAGTLGGRLDLHQQDEVGELAREMDTMSEKLAATNASLERATEARIGALEQLRHADRLVTVGKLASGIAHELGAPLQVVSGRAQMISEEPANAALIREHAGIIHEQARRIAAIIRQLLDFARSRNPPTAASLRERVDLVEFLRTSRSFLGPLLGRREVSLVIEDASEPAVARVDREQLRQVLINLVLNAVQATRDPAEISIRTGRSIERKPLEAAAPSPHVFFCVEDHGHGIAPNDLRHVFEPFFTTKPVGEGTGLGLAVAHGIVEDHGGWIDVKSRVDAPSGTVFTVWLPEAAS